MFEREVMIGTLKRQSQALQQLVHEMEESPKTDWQESQHYHESLKRIEASLKRVRHMDDEMGGAQGFSSQMKYYVQPMRMRDIS